MSPSAVNLYDKRIRHRTRLLQYWRNYSEYACKKVQKINTATEASLKPCSNNTQHKTNKNIPELKNDLLLRALKGETVERPPV